MLVVVGQIGCSKCEMSKKILDKNGIIYDYVILEDLPKEQQAVIVKQAKEQGMMSMPMIFDGNKIISLQEVE